MSFWVRYESPPIPAVRPPEGPSFWVETWTGRIILLNAAVFLYLSYRSGSVMVPDIEALLALGAKDPVGLARGEWWRLIAPVFVHIGIIHFLVNSYMLKVMGWQLERLLGAGWFLLIYLAAGLGGNLASALWNAGLSAGASSSLFGLLGAGVWLERIIGRRMESITGRPPRNRVYAATLVINLGLGILVPFIDNSAHLGGLVVGTILVWAMLNLRPNSLQHRRRWLGRVIVLLLVVGLGAGARKALDADYLAALTESAGDRATHAGVRMMHYSQTLEIAPDLTEVRVKRARAAFAASEPALAWEDVKALAGLPEGRAALTGLAAMLETDGRAAEAIQVRLLAGPD